MIRVRRHRPTAIGNLRLDGLTEPDAAAARRMEAFDELPGSIKRQLVWSSFDFPALKIKQYVEMNGISATVEQVKRSTVAESRRFAIDRQRALDWAREHFQIRGRR